ncbi:hypothetical protein B0H13DRAFT_2321540 [Mycena leptocephala]|nr:hypothetical protein B0H13DRAFT_2321540 [Mycena leptocephala]
MAHLSREMMMYHDGFLLRGQECEGLQKLRAVSAEMATALSSVRAQLDAAEMELELIRADLDHMRGQLVAANTAAEEAQGRVAQLRAESGEREAAVCKLRVQLENMTTAEQPSQDHTCGLTGTIEKLPVCTVAEDDSHCRSEPLLDVFIASSLDEPLCLAIEETSQPCIDWEEQPSPAIRPTAPVIPRQSPASHSAKRLRVSMDHTFAATALPDPSTLPQGGFEADQRFNIVYSQNWGVSAGQSVASCSTLTLTCAPGDMDWHVFYVKYKLDELAFAQAANTPHQVIHLRPGCPYATLAQAVVKYHNIAVLKSKMPGMWIGDGVAEFKAVDCRKAKATQMVTDRLASMQLTLRMKAKPVAKTKKKKEPTARRAIVD